MTAALDANTKNLEQRVNELLAQMTLREKISLLSGKDSWRTVAIPRLGIPSIVMTDGPHGVRATSDDGRLAGPTTCFPTGISMAASWNPDLVEQVGQALGEETRGMGCDILLGPCVNIVRHPLGGRNFETYSEDPFLAGRIGVAMVNGIQSRGVGTSVKHFAVNNHEIERTRASAELDERTLHEIYLAQFEMIVKEAKPWTVMCSYNRVNGVYASQNAELLRQVLKYEWGFEGLVVSDWGANHSIFESIQAGLDLEMPGPAKYYQLLREAVLNWQIDEEYVTAAARRVLRTVLRSKQPGFSDPALINTPAHQALARRLAEEAITLLKNDGKILPVDLDQVKTIAVIGPNAAEAIMQGGGSAHVTAPYKVSPLEALTNYTKGKAQILFEQGCENTDEAHHIPAVWLVGPTGSPGFERQIFATPDFSGEVAEVIDTSQTDFWRPLSTSPDGQVNFSLRLHSRLQVPETGQYRFSFYNNGILRLYIDGALALENRAQPESSQGAELMLNLSAGQPYDLRFDYTCHPWQEDAFYRIGAVRSFETGKDAFIQRAAKAARQADIALVFAGYPDRYEGEGWDRPHMDLNPKQNELIVAVAQANPRTVVILNAGAPVSMAWRDQVAGILLAYYPGMENGNAVARILLGEVNPSGKLPVTFPKRLADSPAYLNAAYPGVREVNYAEGIFVGYRYFDQKLVEPLFPFGHGLSYTSFAYSRPEAPASVKQNESFEVSIVVTNTGTRVGKEIVQVYVADLQSSLPRPPKELKAFQKVELQPNESKVLRFTLNQRSLSFFDPYKDEWMAEPGEFEVLFASSASDVRERVRFKLVE